MIRFAVFRMAGERRPIAHKHAMTPIVVHCYEFEPQPVGVVEFWNEKRKRQRVQFKHGVYGNGQLISERFFVRLSANVRVFQ